MALESVVQPECPPKDGVARSFIARQPIFAGNCELHGYELLFRSGFENFFPDVDRNQASSKVIADSALVMDLRRLVGGCRAFVNVTREVLLNDYISLLPRDLIVIELLETVEPDVELLEVCRRLRRSGYTIALDDFERRARPNPLLDVAEIVKVDFLATDPDGCAAIARWLRGSGKRLLAEKVETRRMAAEARRMGYELFQGFFFAEPEIVAARDVPTFKVNLLDLLRRVHSPELDIAGLDRVIKRDLALTYKLLRYINSAQFGFREGIRSIHHALVLLGLKETRRWATLVVMTSIGRDRPQELVRQALVRARFCEALATPFELEFCREELFLMGLLSLIDTLLGRPMPEILEPLPVPEIVKGALLGRSSPLGPILAYSHAYERGDWATVREASPVSDEATVSRFYVDALDWATKSFGLLRTA